MKEDNKPKTIYELLQEARNNLINNDDSIRELLSRLTGVDKKEWSRQQCNTSFENIIRHYGKNEPDKVKQVLYVSGVTEESTKNSAKDRREDYLLSIKEFNKLNDSYSRRENTFLQKVALEIQKDIDSGEIIPLLIEWFPELEDILRGSKYNGNSEANKETTSVSSHITNNANATSNESSNNTNINTTQVNVTSGNNHIIIIVIIIMLFLTALLLLFLNQQGKIKSEPGTVAEVETYPDGARETVIGENANEELGESEIPSYTADEIDNGILGDKIVFNSSEDEQDFVSVRKVGSDTAWKTDTLILEPNDDYNDEEYEVNVKIKNDNPNGMDAIALGTKVFFEMQQGSAKSIPISARIFSKNAKPQSYSNDVTFCSYINFRLEYVENSAFLMKNNSKKDDGIKLSNIFDKKGVLLGYKTLNGHMPGGEKYSSTITFRIKVIFDAKGIPYTTTTKVRLANKKGEAWKKKVDVKIGDKVEFQINYENTSDEIQNNVAVNDILPSNLKYVDGTTKIYNSTYPKGFLVDSNEVVASGIFIGTYEPGANALIRFQAEVVNDNFTCGKFILHNWGRASVGEKVVQDSAAVIVQLPYCPDPENNNASTE